MIEAMKQALEALYWASDQTEPQQNDHCLCPICKGIDALRQAIAEAEKQEPVAWLHPDWPKHYKQLTSPVVTYPTNGWKPLYTHPQPKREWVGLTHEEIDYQAKKDNHGVYFALGALWAEAKLKEKNT